MVGSKSRGMWLRRLVRALGGASRLSLGEGELPKARGVSTAPLAASLVVPVLVVTSVAVEKRERLSGVSAPGRLSVLPVCGVPSADASRLRELGVPAAPLGAALTDEP